MQRIFCAVLLAFLCLQPVPAQEGASPGRRAVDDATPLAELARSHERVFKELTTPASIVLQKGDKQFTIYGVVGVRAVGSVVEITVKNGEKYSVSAQDVFFITNNAFKI